jgi:hypothetical protein
MTNAISNKIFTIFTLLFFTQISIAQDFISAQIKKTSLKCENNSNIIKIKDKSTNYKPYDKNLKIKKIINCGITKVNKMNFINFLFDGEIQEGPKVYRTLILEFAKYDEKKKVLNTVRSEIVDQIPETGDPAQDGYEQSVEFEFGFHKKNKNLLLKIQPLLNNKKIDAYYLKLNEKKNWFENDFSILKYN